MCNGIWDFASKFDPIAIRCHKAENHSRIIAIRNYSFKRFWKLFFYANPIVHALTSLSSFRCCPASMQSARRNSSCPTVATKRTFLFRIRTGQADCWSSSSGSKVRCLLVLLFDMNPCNADHRIIGAAHNPAITERHAVIYSAVAKDGVAHNLTCLHIKFAFVVKRFSFLERIKTNSLFAMLSTNFHFYLPRNTNAHFIHSGMFAENKPLYIKMESTIDETATTAIKAITTPCRIANFLRLLFMLFSMS
nr:MAG TPA: hypothetical protein [Caudoviricetes sp.]